MGNIYTFYNQGDDYQKAIYIDLLVDIIKIAKSLDEFKDSVHKTVNESKGLLKETDNFIETCKKMNSLIVYYKTSNFIKQLRDLMVFSNEEELIKIRMSRHIFIQRLKDAGYIVEAKWSKNHKNIIEEFYAIPDDEILKRAIRKNNDGSLSFKIEGIQFYKRKFTAFGKTFYLDNPKVLEIYIPVLSTYNLAKTMGITNFNKMLNIDIEKEDVEDIGFLCDIERISKLKRELSTGEEGQSIIDYKFIGLDLIINNSDKPFRLNKTAKSATMKLQFLNYIFYMNPSIKTLNQEDLNSFYIQYKDKHIEFTNLTRKQIILDNLRTSLERTFIKKLKIDYTDGGIFMITSKQLDLIGKN